MTPEQLSSRLEDTIGSAVDKIVKVSVGKQDDVYQRISTLVRDLEIDSNGGVKQSVKNLNAIGKVKAEIEKIFREKGYLSEVKKFAETIKEINALQKDYFTSIEGTFKPPSVVNAASNVSIDLIYESLTGAGINEQITKQVQQILKNNITSGGTFTQVLEGVRDFIKASPNTVGALEKYARQIATDSMYQYAAQYDQIVTADLEFEWYIYTGALIETSRQWCEACKKKKYIHKSELPNVVLGDFPEFEELDGKIYDKTGLPQGMIAGTNAQNVLINRGGYNCGHRFIGVPTASVPKSVRDALII